jgi:hypothetical protein
VIDKLVRPPRKDGTKEKTAPAAPAAATRGRPAEAGGSRQRASTPYYDRDGAETATDAGSETTKSIRAKHRIRFCGDFMKRECHRDVKGGKCSQGAHCSPEEATKKKAAANSACKAELAARKAAQ